ncbi:MAG: hypothetical protein GF350_15685 [Chitinivibrionales bacterium]|nr:hypothetical protein [Chitinivibrionales bacterium]
MRNCYSFYALILGTAACIINTCTVNPTAGNSSQTPNAYAAVAGIIYEPNGKTPAINARVSIRLRSILADTSGLGLPKRLADTATVATDETGKFAFDSTLDTGLYVIESAKGSNYAFMDSVYIIQPKVATISVADTLKPAGSITGTICLSEGGDPRKIIVLAFGVDRFAQVEADGSFMFSSLAEATYDLRIISSLDDYGVLDTFSIPVISADTTNLDTLYLPFTGIPTVKGLSLSYDTLKQIVTLTWNQADTGLVSGYNVYRQHVDSGLVKLNAAVITDTVYQDSTALQDNSYTYQVKSVDKNGNEGKLSSEVGVGVVSAFEVADTLFTAGGNIKGITVDNNGNFIVVRFITPHSPPAKVERYDTTGNLINSWDIVNGVDDGSSTNNVVVDDSGFIYVVNNYDIVSKFDSTGAIIDSFKTQGQLGGIGIFRDTLFIGSRTAHKITAYGISGDSLFSWGNNGFTEGNFVNMVAMVCDKEGNIYVEDAGPTYGRIQIFDKNGSFKNSLSFEQYSLISGETDLIGAQLDVDDSTILATGVQNVYCFNAIGTLLWRLPLEQYVPIRAFFDNAGNIMVALFTGEIISIKR